jgi:ABC-type transport system involved in multi-copper enzyme maturation permease subunit
MVWVTWIAFSLAPLMGGVFMLIMRNPAALVKAGGLQAKAQVMHFAANWEAYLGMLSQAVGVGGILVFGFVASWLFGREYSDGTAKDLLALPTSRPTIINAKFILYLGWCFMLSVSNLLVGFLIGTLLQLPSPGLALVAIQLTRYFMTTLLTVLLGSPLAFFALWGKGYLAPLGFVALTLVLAQIIAASGYGYYFPWSIPGLFSGAGGAYQLQLTFSSYLILLLTAIMGYLATAAFWIRADHSD